MTEISVDPPFGRPQRAGPGRTRPRISFGELPRYLGYVLRRSQAWAYEDFYRAVAELDVSPGQWSLLSLIEANPGLTQNELADAVGLNKSTLTPALRRLEKRRLIERQQRRSDRRFNRIRLTAEGEALFHELHRRIRDHDRALASNLTETERQVLVGLLAKMMDVDPVTWRPPERPET